MPYDVADADCQIFIGGRRLNNGEEGDDIREPTALTGLSIDWGRDTTVDQPGTSSCTFEVLTSGARGMGRNPRTNYVLDPKTSGTNQPARGWLPRAVAVGSTRTPPVVMYRPGGTSWLTGPISPNYGRFYPTSSTPSERPRMTYAPVVDFSIDSGEWLSASVHLLGAGLSNARPARVSVTVTSGGVDVATYTSPPVNLRATEWRRVGVTGLHFGGHGDGYRLEFGFIDENDDYQATGLANAIWFTGLLVEKADDVYAYFDGTFAPSASAEYAWSGAVDASTSVATPLDPWLFTGATVDISARGSRVFDPDANYAVDPSFELTTDGRLRVRTAGGTTNSGQTAAVVTGLPGGVVHTGQRAIKVVPNTFDNGRIQADILPDTFSTTPDPWPDMPTTGTDPSNEIWRGSVWVRATAGTRVTVHLKAMARTDNGGSQGQYFAQRIVTVQGSGWHYIETSGSPTPDQIDRYVAFNVLVEGDRWGGSAAQTWNRTPQETTWTSWTGYTWNDARLVMAEQELTLDDVRLNAPENASTRVFVWSGRVTSLVESWDDTINAPVTKVTCHDFNAELANLDVGDVPWNREVWRQRYNRIMTASGMAASIRVIYPPTGLPDTIFVKARDVDSQPAGTLLGELVTSVDGVQWSATDDVEGPYLLIEDPSARMTQDDVFHGAALSTKTNYAYNPRGNNFGGRWGFQNGTGGTDVLSYVANAKDGPTLPDGSRSTTYARLTTTTPKTASNSGIFYRATAGDASGGGITTRMALSMYVRPSVPLSVIASGQLRNGAAVVVTAQQPTRPIPANVWTRIDITTPVSGATYDGFQIWAQLAASQIMPAGATFDATLVLAERGTNPVVGEYFDGSMRDRDPQFAYAWVGSPGASRSTWTHWARRQDVLELDSCRVLREPVQWTQDTQDVSTRVTVTWTDPAPPAGGETDRVAQVVDTAAEAKYGKRRVSVSSQLTTNADALNVANRILNRVRVLDWRARTLSVDASVINNDEMTPVSFSETWLALLNGTRRNGLPLVLSNLPDWVPVNQTDMVVYVEGGKYTHESGAWALDVTVSNAPTPAGVQTFGLAEARTELVTITNGGAPDAGTDD